METTLTPLARLSDQPLLWQHPSVGWRDLFSSQRKPHRLLVEGTETVAVELTTAPSVQITEATGTWQLVVPRLFSSLRQVFNPQGQQVAELRYGLGSTTLVFYAGQTYHWKRGMQWEDDYHSPIVTLARKWNEPGKTRVTVGPECHNLPELALLAGLGWFLLLQSDEASAAVISAAAVSS